MLRAFLREDCSRIRCTEFDPDGRRRSPPSADGVTARAHHVVSVPHRETNLDPPTPTPPSQTCSEASMGRPASAVVSRGRRLPQGHAKGTPTWFTDLTPALSWTFSEPCRSDGYVWEVMIWGRRPGVFPESAGRRPEPLTAHART